MNNNAIDNTIIYNVRKVVQQSNSGLRLSAPDLCLYHLVYYIN